METGRAHFFDQAREIEAKLRETKETQEQLSHTLGVSQSYIANKLRLLRLTDEEQEQIRESGLSERHARALLRIPESTERLSVLQMMAERRMNVAEAEEAVEELLRARARAEELHSRPPEAQARMIGRELRSFCASIDRAVDGIRRCGVTVEATKIETEEGTVIRIRLPKAI